jgi:CheY-like chemotaxis protein
MRGAVDRIRDRWLIIPHVRVQWPETFPLNRPVRGQQGSDNPAIDPVRPSQQVLHKRVILIAMEGCRINENARALERAGYEVRIMSGLCDALEAARQSHPSLFIVCGGMTVTRTCLALRDTTNAPILALLTEASEADLLAILDAGADDCQPASIGAQEVLMRTRVLLRRRAR